MFWAVALIAVYFIFTPIALIIASPFNDWLSERAEKDCGLAPAERGESLIRSVTTDALFAVAAECQRMLYFATVSMAILCVNLIPVVGSAAFPVLSIYWACRWAAFEFVCFSADRRRLPWKEVWKLLRRNWPVSMGFGSATALLMAIPFVNVLMVTVSAVGGTFLFGLIQDSLMRESP